MPISMSRYVEITSAVAGGGGVAQQKLVGRVFVDNPLLIPGVIVSVAPGGAGDFFGPDSTEASFANQYFSYISPSPASQAPELQFAAWVSEDRPSRIYAKPTSVGYADLKAIDAGTMDLTIDGKSYTLTGIDISEAADLAAALGVINGAITTAVAADTGAKVIYDATNKRYVLESLKNGAQGALIADTGTLCQLLGFDDPDVESPGADAQTPLEAFQIAENVTDSFGSACFLGMFGTATLSDIASLASYVSAQNVKYMLVVGAVAGEEGDYDEARLSEALIGTASCALVLSSVPGEFKEALPMAIMAATDYDRKNATINYMYRQPGVTWHPDVMSDIDADTYDAMRMNYFGQTATAGQKISFFQRGVLCGPASAPLTMSVHANEQWFKAKVKADLMSLFLSVGKIPANTDGKGMVLSVVQGAIDQALVNGTIIKAKTITPIQQIAITQLTGDPEAWRAIQVNGFWADAQVVEFTNESGVTEYAVKYTVVYSKGDAVSKIEGSHNLI